MRQDFAAAGAAKARMVASSNAAAGRDLFCFIPIIKLELHSDRLAIGLGGLEELARGEVEHSGKDVRGERLDLSIEVANDGVVVAAGVLDWVFRLTQRFLPLREFLRSL